MREKIFLTLIYSVGLSLKIVAQGTIQFQNFSGATGRVYTNSYESFNGAILAPAGFSYTVALLAGAVGAPAGSLTLVATFTNTVTGNGQFFDGQTITVSTPAGTSTSDPTMNVELMIEAWTGNFSTYSAAINATASGGSIIGVTAPFNNPTGGSGTSLPAALIGWTSANDIILAPDPEPSTIAVGGLGAAILIVFSRRKKTASLLKMERE